MSLRCVTLHVEQKLSNSYLATGLLVRRFDLLSLLVTPFHQNFNNGVLIHTCTKKVLIKIIIYIILHLYNRDKCILKCRFQFL